MQLQVIVNKLNKRKSPVTDFKNKSNVIGVVSKGFTFESDGEITNILGTWVKDRDESFYWGEALSKIDTVLTQETFANVLEKIPFDANKMSWAHDSVVNGGLGIVDLWNLANTRGEGIKVAIVDTGTTFRENDLKGKIDISLSIDCTLTNLDDTDFPEFHGTKSSGVVAANGATTNTVFGVAPDCELIIYKLFSNKDLNGYTDKNFCFILQEARKAKVDIISMSFEMTDKPEEIDAEIQACLDQNIILIASAGDDNQILGIKNKFPASLPGCISIGAYKLLNKQPAIFSDHSCQSDFLFCLGPGENILTTGATGVPIFHHFTSAAAPFVAGIIAIILSYRKRRNLPISTDLIKKSIQSTCNRINTTVLKDEKEGFGVINPIGLFDLLKK